MEFKYKLGDWVWSKKQQKAMKIIPFFDDNQLLTVSLHAANYYTDIYTLASGNQILESLEEIEKVTKLLDETLNKVRGKMEEDNFDNYD
jgi:hypothetical protein